MTSPKRDPRDVLREYETWLHDHDTRRPDIFDLAAALRETLAENARQKAHSEEWVQEFIDHSCQMERQRDAARSERDQLARDNERLRARLAAAQAARTQAETVIAAARRFQVSFAKHYHGYPGKLEWPEIHGLRQTLAALDSQP